MMITDRWMVSGLCTLTLLALLGLILCFACAAQETTETGEVIWNSSGVYVKLQPFEEPVSFEGLVLNCYYNESHTDGFYVVLVAYNCTPSAYTTATFALYDYWTGENIGNYSVSGMMEVSVPSNMTVVYIIVGSHMFGPYYISTIPVQITPPEELQPYIPLLLFSIMVMLAGRGDLRDAGLGMLAFGILAVPIAKAFGVSSPWTPLLSVASIVMGLLLLYAASLKKPT